MSVIYDTVCQLNQVVNACYVAANVNPVTFFGSAARYSREKKMFSGFGSFADLQNALRAPLAMPIICLTLSATILLDSFKKFALTALQLGTLSPVNAYNSFKNGLIGILASAYVALRAIFDVIRSTIVLVTRSVSTVAAIACLGVLYSGLGVFKAGAAVGAAVKGIFIKSPACERVKTPLREDVDAASMPLDMLSCGA